MFKRFLIIGLVLIGAFVTLALWGVVAFRSQPIEALEKMTRLSLRMGGGERQTVNTDDGTLVYFTVGEGQTVFLLHGANDQAGRWAKSVAKLKDKYRFVIPDLPGHGDSDPATGPLRFSMMLHAVEVLKKTESPEDAVVIVGNSMGGWVALLYTLEHPDDVRQLVLEDSGGISLEGTELGLVPTTRDEARVAFDKVLATETPIPNFILDDFVRRAPTSQVARMSDEDFDALVLDDRLQDVVVPTTLIWGEEDELLNLEFAKRMQSMIPGAELRTIALCGHIPHNECPGDFSELLDEALQEGSK